MTIKKLASEIAKREGKKSQTQIGDIREILSILSDMINDEYEKLCNENKSIVVSLVVIALLLTASVVASLLDPKKKPAPPSPPA